MKKAIFLLLFLCEISFVFSQSITFSVGKTSKSVTLEEIKVRANRTEFILRTLESLKLAEPGSKNAFYVQDEATGNAYALRESSVPFEEKIPANTQFHLFFDKIPLQVKSVSIIVNSKKDEYNLAKINYTLIEVSKSLKLEQPGTLSTVLTAEELNTITTLNLSGTIFASDFKTMRDKMPSLMHLDLSRTNIAGYVGTEGTNSSENQTYNANCIPERAFYNKDLDLGKSSLISVKLPLTIKSIGRSAFCKCNSLDSIELPFFISEIGSTAFFECSTLSKINIPNKVRAIGESAFDGCTKLAAIDMKVTESGAIIYMTSGKEIFTGINKTACILYVPVGYLNEYQKASPWNLFGTIVEKPDYNINGTTCEVFVTNPGSLSTILPQNLLETVTNLTVTGFIDACDFVTLRDNLPKLEKLNLSNVNISAYTGSNGTYNTNYCRYQINQVPPRAFYNAVTKKGKASLVEVILPFYINVILQSTFANCISLAKITIPTKVANIEISAFADCRNLHSIEIPPSVSFIDQTAFKDCPAEMSVAPANNNYYSVDGVLYEKNQNALMQCPSTKKGDFTIPASTTILRSASFQNCQELTAISIPNSITQIEANAFANCTRLTTITIPASVTSISDSTFMNCTGLTSVTLPSTLLSIGTSAFQNCRRLMSCEFPSGLQPSENAFLGCLALDSINLVNKNRQDSIKQAYTKQVSDFIQRNYARNVFMSNQFFMVPGDGLYSKIQDDIYKLSNETGDNWFVTDQQTRSISRDPNNQSIIYRLVTGNMVSKSVDRGVNWIDIQNGLPSGVECRSIAVNPTNSAEVFLLANDGLYKTSDAGFTWFILKSFNYPEQFIIDNIHPETFYVPTQNDFFLSTDAGKTWRSIGAKLPTILKNGTGRTAEYVPATIYNAASINLNSTSYLLAFTELGTYQTYDLGNSWSKLNNAQIVTTYISDDGIYLGGCIKEEDGNIVRPVIYKSDKNGANWVKVNYKTDDKLSFINGIYSLVNKPGILISTINKEIQFLDPEGHVIGLNYGVTPHSIIHSSATVTEADGSKTNYALVENQSAVDLLTYGIWKSKDGGISWKPSNIYVPMSNWASSPLRKMFVSPFDPKEVWSFDQELGYVTFDGGNIWINIHDNYNMTGISNAQFLDFSFDFQNKNIIYFAAGVNEYYLYRYDKSTGGATKLRECGSSFIVSKDNDKNMVTNLFEVSNDGGWSWNSFKDVIEKLVENQINFNSGTMLTKAIDYTGSTIRMHLSQMNMQTDNEVFVKIISTDNGKTWQIEK